MEAVSGGVDVRRRPLLVAERRADSANLRDLLGFRQDENNNNGNNRSNIINHNNSNLVGLTLGAVLSGDMRSMSMPVQSNRTLLDIIRDEPFGKNAKDGKKSWKLLKQKLKLRRVRPGLDVQNNNNNNNNNSRAITRRNSAGVVSEPGVVQQREEEVASSSSLLSVMMQSSSAVMVPRNTSQAVDREGVADLVSGEVEEGRGESPDGGGEGQPARMSLMALLEETDRQMGFDGPGFLVDDDEENENEYMDVNVAVDVDVDVDVEVDRDAGDGERVVELNSCCVCMVRHKGAAFIPCGHTFCRLCSRELWVQRGNCPLCNNMILEILDIF